MPGLLPGSGQGSICRYRSCCTNAAVYQRGVYFNINSWDKTGTCSPFGSWEGLWDEG